jgi:hypothetical protein
MVFLPSVGGMIANALTRVRLDASYAPPLYYL